MSCPSTLNWSIYVDGELEPEDARHAELHLVSCLACRAEVVALQEESVALVNALYERSSVPLRPALSAAPARDLALGLPAAVAAVMVVLTVAGLLIDQRLPSVLDLLHPRRLMGAYEMAFDSVFMLRRQLPGLFDLATSVGVVAAISALGCAGVHALSRRLLRSSSVGLLLILALTSPDAAHAIDLRLDQDTHIGRDQTIDETLVCTGERIAVDGTIDGDLVVGAERFNLRGAVTGNLYVFGGEVEIEGHVAGSVILIGEHVRLGGTVDGGVLLGGERLTVDGAARVGRDITLFGNGVRLDGSAERDVNFAGEWLEVSGAIARDLHVLGAERVSLLDGARIGGDVRARLWRASEIEQAATATIGGELNVEEESIVREHYLARYADPGFYLMLLVAAAAAFVFGLLLYALDPRLFEADPPDTRSFFRSLGTGFVMVLAGPVALALIALTVIGLPVAFLLGFILIAAVYSSYVLVAGLVGQAAVRPSGPGLGAFAPSLLAGVLILSAASALPFVGPPLRIVAVLFGLGCLFERARGLRALNLRGTNTR